MANACTSSSQTLSEVVISETKDNDMNQTSVKTSASKDSVCFENNLKSTNDNGGSKTHDESCSTSIRAATEMPSASGESTYSDESSEIATKSNESACPKVSNSLTFEEMRRILRVGDLTSMHEIDAWAAAMNRKGELSEGSEFAQPFTVAQTRMALHYTHSFISLTFT